MITQLLAPIPLITPRGVGMAHLVIDYGMDHDLQWVTFLVESGECWTFRNQEVRLVENQTMGRGKHVVITDSILDVMEASHTNSKIILANSKDPM